MAEITDLNWDEIGPKNTVGLRSTYPWAEWFDGKQRKLTTGNGGDVTAKPVSFVNMAKAKAKANGKTLRSAILKSADADGVEVVHVVIQAFDAPAAPAAAAPAPETGDDLPADTSV